MPPARVLFLVLSCVWCGASQTAIRKVSEENVTLPCQHRMSLLRPQSLDIEWLLQESDSSQKVVITYSGGSVYKDLIESMRGRVSFVSNFLAGDASLQIQALQPSDAGQYICKVKNAGKYEWSYITLQVLVKPSEPKCWTEGLLSVGENLSLHCKSAAGTEPIMYQWQRIHDREGKLGPLPPTSRFGSEGHVVLQNLSSTDNGSYRCLVTNEAGKGSCDVQVVVQVAHSIGVILGAVCSVLAGIFLIFLTVCLTLRRKETKKYEEEEPPNEIREDAEAPKARLVQPGSSFSGSRSSRSGSSSTRSTTNSACRSQQTLSTQATPRSAPQHYSRGQAEARSLATSQGSYASPMRLDATPIMVPAQNTAFQMV
ncbi:CXADR-like membrane protein [Ambystoma mexicanum]|uniref:CXADR-like membrane protein n=1 Tax=Ambystoma mexicanum TaxID=8296 RepID=UPI0037E924D3